MAPAFPRPERRRRRRSLSPLPRASSPPETRSFRRSSRSPLTYLTGWRMQSAAALLGEGELTVAEIAERVGYESLPAFSKAFKRRTGGVLHPGEGAGGRRE
ncbi:MAG TPA: helix-turn-helix transcriptional regulator [Myxococcales bacterium]|nr:helix-turn-helix transcriptional regulator [Myxococcales bacterium]